MPPSTIPPKPYHPRNEVVEAKIFSQSAGSYGEATESSCIAIHLYA